jgi:hypothetical protein
MSRLQTLWYDRMSGRHKHSDLNDPMFEASRDVQDWRNYVGAYVQQIWKTLDGEHRAAIALDADERASREEWD